MRACDLAHDLVPAWRRRNATWTGRHALVVLCGFRRWRPKGGWLQVGIEIFEALTKVSVIVCIALSTYLPTVVFVKGAVLMMRWFKSVKYLQAILCVYGN